MVVFDFKTLFNHPLMQLRYGYISQHGRKVGRALFNLIIDYHYQQDYEQISRLREKLHIPREFT